MSLLFAKTQHQQVDLMVILQADVLDVLFGKFGDDPHALQLLTYDRGLMHGDFQREFSNP